MLRGGVVRGEGAQKTLYRLLHLLLLHPAQCDQQPVAVLRSQRLHLLRAQSQQRVALQRVAQLHLAKGALQLHAAADHAAQWDGADQLALRQGDGVRPLRGVHLLDAHQQHAQLHGHVEGALRIGHAISEAEQRVHGIRAEEGERGAQAVADDYKHQLGALDVREGRHA